MSLPNIITARADCNHTSFHVDTIGVYSLKWWKGAIEAMLATLDNPKDCQRRKSQWGTGYDLHHPTDRTFLLLAHWRLTGCKFKTSRAHVARDEVMDDTDQLGEHMEDLWDGLRLKWASPKAQPIRFGALNFYLADYTKQDRMRRNCLVYKKGMRVRTELRFLNSDAVRRNGLDDMHELSKEDLSALLPALFEKHLHMLNPY